MKNDLNARFRVPSAEPHGFVYWRYKGVEAIDEPIRFVSPERHERTAPALRLAPEHHYWYGVLVADPATGLGSTDRIRLVKRNRAVAFPGLLRRTCRPYRIVYEQTEPSAFWGYAPPIAYRQYGYAFVIEHVHPSELVPFLERRRLDTARDVRPPIGTVTRSFWPVLRAQYCRRIDHIDPEGA